MRRGSRRQRLAAVKSFYGYAVEERGLERNPIQMVKPPKQTDVSRNAYTRDVIDQLRDAQPTVRDQICVQLLGVLGLRRSESPANQDRRLRSRCRNGERPRVARAAVVAAQVASDDGGLPAPVDGGPGGGAARS